RAGPPSGRTGHRSNDLRSAGEMTAPLPADPLLSVVMPVFNERGTIDEIIRRVLGVAIRTELIVIDDASTDGTGERLQALSKELGFVLLLQNRNRGKGAAVRQGFARVTGDVVVIQDADLECSSGEYPQLIDLVCQGHAD